jgi:hypothetical protein
MALVIVVVASGGVPITKAANGRGVPVVTPLTAALSPVQSSLRMESPWWGPADRRSSATRGALIAGPSRTPAITYKTK